MEPEPWDTGRPRSADGEMRRIRIAVIGVGRQGRRHGEKLAGLSEARLVAVLDADRGRAGAVAAELGVDAAADLADLAGGTDAAVVATPTPTHFEIAAALLERGIHVLLEKPLARSLEQAAALVELAEARGLVLQVGHLERFDPAVIILYRRIDNPRFIEAHRIAPFRERGLDVSVVLDLMIHDIDLIHAFAGAPVTHAEASGGRVFSDQVDVANARVRFANGCVANLTASRVSLKTERTLRIFQDRGYLSADLHRKQLTSYTARRPGVVRSPDDVHVEQRRFTAGDALRDECEAFLAAVAGKRPTPVSGRVALEALRTASMIGEMIRDR